LSVPPSVSVLLPVRDGGAHLDEAVDSMLRQTHRDLELIVVDDGSEDDTPARLERWSARDRRVRVERQPPAGIVAALERARAAARGPLLARMDADDVAEPTRLEAQVALLRERPELAACGCGVRYFPREAVEGGARRYERWINGVVSPEEISASMFVECPIAHPTLLARSDAMEAVGGWRDRSWPEDYDLVLRLWAAGHRLGKVPDVLHHWREGPDRLSRTDARYAPEAFLACKVRHLRRTLLRDGRSAVVWGAGPVGKRFARALLAAGTVVEAFVDLDPRKIGQAIHGAPVLEPAEAVLLRAPLHLAAVGQKGARTRIVETLSGAGHRPLQGFVPVA
jgi:cellulose synthase/poly-beta-1,6-N-acetylglucosamine synthase-like glycosyltransferase